MDAGRHTVKGKGAHLVHEFKDCLEFMGEAFLLLLGEAEADLAGFVAAAAAADAADRGPGRGTTLA